MKFSVIFEAQLADPTVERERQVFVAARTHTIRSGHGVVCMSFDPALLGNASCFLGGVVASTRKDGKNFGGVGGPEDIFPS